MMITDATLKNYKELKWVSGNRNKSGDNMGIAKLTLKVEYRKNSRVTVSSI